MKQRRHATSPQPLPAPGHADVSHAGAPDVGRRATVGTVLGLMSGLVLAQATPRFPITETQRGTARQVAEAGVPLSELSPRAPDRYTVKPGDTLWAISALFLNRPWRWPELWGMNLQQIANPHLIYPGQLLVLVRANGRARLQFGESAGPAGTVKLSPHGRSTGLDTGPIAAIPLHLIQPFLNEAVVLEKDDLDTAPRIVAAQDGRVLMGRGDLAYVRGTLVERRDWRVFRQARPLTDPDTGEVLGYEGAFVGAAQYTRRSGEVQGAGDQRELVPATFVLNSVRQEANIGDRLAPALTAEDESYVPHAPTKPLDGRVVSVYGDALTAGHNQVVALNRGKTSGVEPGHVLGLLRAGSRLRDSTSPDRAALHLPDEPNGHLLVFRVFNRVSYALILTAAGPVRAGDRFTQP